MGTGSEWPESGVTGADDKERVAECEVRAVTGTVSHEVSKSAYEWSWEDTKSLDIYPMCA